MLDFSIPCLLIPVLSLGCCAVYEDLCRAEAWGRRCSQFIVVLTMVSLELSLLPAGAAPAPYTVPF